MRKFIALFLLVAVTTLSYAQENRTTKYGIRAAYNISNLDFEPGPLFENQHRNGFAFGGFAEFELSDKTFLLTEIQWSAEGAKAQEIRADYIQMPIQFRYAISENLTIGAGPQVSLKTWKDNDGFETFAFSAVGGLEYMISSDYFIDLRYNYGLTNILDDSLAPFEAKNYNIQIGIGIKI
ncbi:porin family protein [Winogradskyella maritima]|uniref:Porin family protein n=1 Tax=Winogradskyella maritima TaxID=1517766 RepID=A0ABV8AHZ8_9FLAO|nr:porin family protein [Winogradskyella maritima]